MEDLQNAVFSLMLRRGNSPLLPIHPPAPKKSPGGSGALGGGGNPAQSLPFPLAFTLASWNRLSLMDFRLTFPRRRQVSGAPELGGGLGA